MDDPTPAPKRVSASSESAALLNARTAAVAAHGLAAVARSRRSPIGPPPEAATPRPRPRVTARGCRGPSSSPPRIPLLPAARSLRDDPLAREDPRQEGAPDVRDASRPSLVQQLSPSSRRSPSSPPSPSRSSPWLPPPAGNEIVAAPPVEAASQPPSKCLGGGSRCCAPVMFHLSSPRSHAATGDGRRAPPPSRNSIDRSPAPGAAHHRRGAARARLASPGRPEGRTVAGETDDRSIPVDGARPRWSPISARRDEGRSSRTAAAFRLPPSASLPPPPLLSSRRDSDCNSSWKWARARAARSATPTADAVVKGRRERARPAEDSGFQTWTS